MKQTILVVEDTPTILTVIREILLMEGYDVFTAENGKVALHTLESCNPDLIISDIMMPVMDGYELFDKVHENPNLTHVPFIFLTAKSTKKDVQFGKKMGADDYISKPFDNEDLIAAVRGKLHRMQELETHKGEEIREQSEHIVNFIARKLQAPLSTIRGWIHFLQDPTNNLSWEEARKIYELLKQNSDEMDSILEKFLLLGRLEEISNEKAFDEKSAILSINDIIDYTIKKWSSNINILYNKPKDNLKIQGQTELLTITLDELLDNASKNSKSIDEAVIIRTEANEKMIRIDIQDKGYGISETDLPKIFDKLYQCQRKNKSTTGIGLGLALAKMIVEKHRGTISVKSVMNEGSTFSLMLPRYFEKAPELVMV